MGLLGVCEPLGECGPPAPLCGPYILVQDLWDELPLAVDAGAGPLPCNLLLLLRDTAGRRRRAPRVQGAWGVEVVMEVVVAEKDMWERQKEEKDEKK